MSPDDKARFKSACDRVAAIEDTLRFLALEPGAVCDDKGKLLKEYNDALDEMNSLIWSAAMTGEDSL